MPRDDEARWDARHMAADDADPAPSELLVEMKDRLPSAGRVLDLACGRGRNAVWLARRGLDVDAVDVSTIALAKMMTLAARHGVAGRVRPIAHDLTRGLPPLNGTYEIVLCLHFRQPDLWPKLAALASAPSPGRTAGGLLLIETLARHPSNLDVDPAFLGERDELLAAADGLAVEFHGRVTTGKRATDRLVARRAR